MPEVLHGPQRKRELGTQAPIVRHTPNRGLHGPTRLLELPGDHLIGVFPAMLANLSARALELAAVVEAIESPRKQRERRLLHRGRASASRAPSSSRESRAQASTSSRKLTRRTPSDRAISRSSGRRRISSSCARGACSSPTAPGSRRDTPGGSRFRRLPRADCAGSEPSSPRPPCSPSPRSRR